MALTMATTLLSGAALGQELPRKTVIIDTNKLQPTKACLEAFSSVQTNKGDRIVCDQYTIEEYKAEMIQPGRWLAVKDLGDGVLCGFKQDEAVRFMFIRNAEGQYYHITDEMNASPDNQFFDLYIAGQQFMAHHKDSST